MADAWVRDPKAGPVLADFKRLRAAMLAFVEADLAAVDRSKTPWLAVTAHYPWRAPPPPPPLNPGPRGFRLTHCSWLASRATALAEPGASHAPRVGYHTHPNPNQVPHLQRRAQRGARRQGAGPRRARARPPRRGARADAGRRAQPLGRARHCRPRAAASQVRGRLLLRRRRPGPPTRDAQIFVACLGRCR